MAKDGIVCQWRVEETSLWPHLEGRARGPSPFPRTQRDREREMMPPEEEGVKGCISQQDSQKEKGVSMAQKELVQSSRLDC